MLSQPHNYPGHNGTMTSTGNMDGLLPQGFALFDDSDIYPFTIETMEGSAVQAKLDDGSDDKVDLTLNDTLGAAGGSDVGAAGGSDVGAATVTYGGSGEPGNLVTEGGFTKRAQRHRLYKRGGRCHLLPLNHKYHLMAKTLREKDKQQQPRKRRTTNMDGVGAGHVEKQFEKHARALEIIDLTNEE